MKDALVCMGECVKKLVEEMTECESMRVGFLTASAAKFLSRF